MTVVAPTAPAGTPAEAPTGWSVPPRARAALAVLAASAAFAPSLAGLVADLRYGAPTGDLVAVPVVSAVLLDAAVRSRREVWAGRLGLGDLVVAAGLGVLALGLVLVPSGRVTNGHWLTRLDLLGYPLAVAAFAVLLLGMRVLAVGLVPLAYGLLVWPWPVTWLNIHAVAPLTEGTYRVSGTLAELLGVARMVDVGGENTLRIGQDAAAFEVSVAPACSGISGIVAYLVVGGAVLALTRGRPAARAAWLALGLLAVWLGNVLRICLLAAVGERYGAHVSLNLLHPVAGLALNAVVVVVMVGLLGRFGLHWAPVARGAVTEGAATANDERVRFGPTPARQVAGRSAVVALATAGLLLATTHVNGSAGAFSATAQRPVVLADVARLGDGAQFVGRQDWSTVYFGADSAWNRYRVAVPAAGGVRSVWVDSLEVTDDKALRAHDVLACYSFHGARVWLDEPVRIAGRVSARRFVVTQVTGEQWQSLYWEWPLVTPAGVRYERVTLFVGAAPPEANPGGAPAGSAAPGATEQAAAQDALDSLVAAAEVLVRGSLAPAGAA